MLDLEDQRLIVSLSAAGPCSLNHSPKKNWVEKNGGLPNYICHIAKAVGKGSGSGGSIAIAIGVAKKWASGAGKVTPATRAKASAAVAQWEALKARAHAHHVVKASDTTRDMLSVTLSNTEDFNTAIVGNAWQEYMEHCGMLASARRQMGEDVTEPDGDEFIKELWNNYVIAQDGYEDSTPSYYRVPYTVNGTDVEFGDWTPVMQTYTDAPAGSDSDDGDSLDDDALADIQSSAPTGSMPFYDSPEPSKYAGW